MKVAKKKFIQPPMSSVNTWNQIFEKTVQKKMIPSKTYVSQVFDKEPNRIKVTKVNDSFASCLMSNVMSPRAWVEPPLKQQRHSSSVFRELSPPPERNSSNRKNHNSFQMFAPVEQGDLKLVPASNRKVFENANKSNLSLKFSTFYGNKTQSQQKLMKLRIGQKDAQDILGTDMQSNKDAFSNKMQNNSTFISSDPKAILKKGKLFNQSSSDLSMMFGQMPLRSANVSSKNSFYKEKPQTSKFVPAQMPTESKSKVAL